MLLVNSFFAFYFWNIYSHSLFSIPFFFLLSAMSYHPPSAVASSDSGLFCFRFQYGELAGYQGQFPGQFQHHSSFDEFVDSTTNFETRSLTETDITIHPGR